MFFSIVILFQISNFNLAYANNNGVDNYIVYNTSPYMMIPCYIDNVNNKMICSKRSFNYGNYNNFEQTEDYIAGKYVFKLNESILEQIKNKVTVERNNSYDLTILLLNHMDYFITYYPISDVNQAILYLDEKSKNNTDHIKQTIIESSFNYLRMYDNKRLELDNKTQNNKNQLIQMINQYSGIPFMWSNTMFFTCFDFKNKGNCYNWYLPSKLNATSDKSITIQNKSGYVVKLDGSEYEVFYIQLQIQSKQSTPKTARFFKLKNQSQNDFFNKVLVNEYQSSFLNKNHQEMEKQIDGIYKESFDIIRNWKEQLYFMKQLTLDNKNKQFIQQQINIIKIIQLNLILKNIITIRNY